MSGVNKAILIGNLGANPEVRYTQGGSTVANLRLATTRRWTGKDGQRQEETEWHNVVAFGKLADICSQYLQKGKQIYVEGRIRTRQWQDQQGNKRYTTEIVMEQMTMLGARGAPAAGEEMPETVPAESPPRDDLGAGDDDVPF